MTTEKDAEELGYGTGRERETELDGEEGRGRRGQRQRQMAGGWSRCEERQRQEETEAGRGRQKTVPRGSGRGPGGPRAPGHPRPPHTHLHKVVDGLQIGQVVVIDIHADAEVQASIASVDDLKVPELWTERRSAMG